MFSTEMAATSGTPASTSLNSNFDGTTRRYREVMPKGNGTTSLPSLAPPCIKVPPKLTFCPCCVRTVRMLREERGLAGEKVPATAPVTGRDTIDTDFRESSGLLL